jgi:MFS family permease
MGPSLGTLLATGFITIMTLAISADDFQSWGWRVPFLASIVLVGFGLWIRSGVDESPMFRQLHARHAMAEAPISEVLRHHWRRLLIAGGARIGPDVLFSLLIVFTLTYLTTILHLSRTFALTAVSIGGAFNALSVPYFGALSDRYGRRAVYGFGALIGIAWAFFFFRLLDSLDPLAILLAVTSGFLIHAVMYGPQAAFITEQFPTRVRYAGSSLAYTLVGIVGGALAPVVFASLLRAYRTTFGISLYLTAALCVSGIALLVARETSRVPLEQ